MPPTSSAQRLPRHARREREQALLLAAAAGVSALTSLWLLAMPSTIVRLFAAAGVLFAVVFARRGRLCWLRSKTAPERFLELGHEALSLHDGASPRQLSWSRVHAVEVDEERLQVALLDAEGNTLLGIEPDFGGLGVYALRDAVASAWERGDRAGGCGGEGCNAENPG